jgi:hypothetical protein
MLPNSMNVIAQARGEAFHSEAGEADGRTPLLCILLTHEEKSPRSWYLIF